MYFDTLQDHRTESGKPSGALKIKEVPELAGKRRSESSDKRRVIKRGLEWNAIFYGEEHVTANELKASMPARAAE